MGIAVGPPYISGLVKADARFAGPRSSGPVEVHQQGAEAHVVESPRLAKLESLLAACPGRAQSVRERRSAARTMLPVGSRALPKTRDARTTTRPRSACARSPAAAPRLRKQAPGSSRRETGPRVVESADRVARETGKRLSVAKGDQVRGQDAEQQHSDDRFRSEEATHDSAYVRRRFWADGMVAESPASTPSTSLGRHPGIRRATGFARVGLGNRLPRPFGGHREAFPPGHRSSSLPRWSSCTPARGLRGSEKWPFYTNIMKMYSLASSTCRFDRGPPGVLAVLPARPPSSSSYRRLSRSGSPSLYAPLRPLFDERRRSLRSPEAAAQQHPDGRRRARVAGTLVILDRLVRARDLTNNRRWRQVTENARGDPRKGGPQTLGEIEILVREVDQVPDCAARSGRSATRAPEPIRRPQRPRFARHDELAARPKVRGRRARPDPRPVVALAPRVTTSSSTMARKRTVTPCASTLYEGIPDGDLARSSDRAVACSGTRSRRGSWAKGEACGETNIRSERIPGRPLFAARPDACRAWSRRATPTSARSCRREGDGARARMFEFLRQPLAQRTGEVGTSPSRSSSNKPEAAGHRASYDASDAGASRATYTSSQCAGQPKTRPLIGASCPLGPVVAEPRSTERCAVAIGSTGGLHEQDPEVPPAGGGPPRRRLRRRLLAAARARRAPCRRRTRPCSSGWRPRRPACAPARCWASCSPSRKSSRT